MKLYQQLLSIGRKTVCLKQRCGSFKKQLQSLHDYVYIVESTPHPEDPTYSPMFLDCIIHSSYWTLELQHQLKQHHLSFSVLDYSNDSHCFFQPEDTQKRRLLYEMTGKWWFFHDTMAPTLALSEVLRFRDRFFEQPFAYFPQKFRTLVEQGGFQEALDKISMEEHKFLDKMLSDMNKRHIICGCFPSKQTPFSQRLAEPSWHDLPDLEIYELAEIDVDALHHAVVDGEFLYMMVSNYHDGLDRTLYQQLYDIFQNMKKH